MDRLIVGDVGKGQCVYIESQGQNLLVDAPNGASGVDFVTSVTTRLDAALVSHADTDHAGGIVNLVARPDFPISRFYLNPEHRRRANEPTAFMDTITAAIRTGRHQGTRTFTSLTAELDPILIGDLTVDVLWPTPDAAHAGIGGNVGYGRLDANALSVVIRIEHRNGYSALIPGDLNHVGFASLRSEAVDLSASFLIAPHHGGRLGTVRQTKAMWQGLMTNVSPSEVFVSFGREDSPKNPLDDALAAINVPVRCTQLSEECCDVGNGLYLETGLWSAGAAEGHSCAGSIELDLSTGRVTYGDHHSEAVRDAPFRNRCSH